MMKLPPEPRSVPVSSAHVVPALVSTVSRLPTVVEPLGWNAIMSPTCGAAASRHAETAEAPDNAAVTKIPPRIKDGSRLRKDRFGRRINDPWLNHGAV